MNIHAASASWAIQRLNEVTAERDALAADLAAAREEIAQIKGQRDSTHYQKTVLHDNLAAARTREKELREALTLIRDRQPDESSSDQTSFFWGWAKRVAAAALASATEGDAE